MKDIAPIILFVYSLCNGISSPLLALQWATESYNHLKEEDEPSVEIYMTFIFENSAKVNQVGRALLQFVNYPGEIEFVGDLNNFTHHAAQLPLKIPAGRSYRVIVLSGTPCKSISSACRRSPFRRKFGIHAEPSNVFWLAHSGLRILFQDHDQWLFSFSENVVPGSIHDLNVLDTHMGYRYQMNVPPGLGAPRRRYVWINFPMEFPAVSLPSTDELGRFKLPMDWDYPPLSKGLPCLRAIFPFLFWEFAVSPEDMTPDDRNVVISCQLIHKPYNQLRLPSLAIWASAMGIDSCIVHIMQTIFPCTGTVSTNYPLFKKDPCGLWAYCDNCCEILTMLGEGWHLTLVSHFVFHAFCQFISFTDTQDQPFFQFEAPAHQCSPSCPLARTQL